MLIKQITSRGREWAQVLEHVFIGLARRDVLSRSPRCSKKMAGQSLAETLLVMLAILLFFTAIPWLGRLLDIGLNQENASSYAAFQYTQQLDGVDEEDIKNRFFLGADKNWRDRQQALILDSGRAQIVVKHEQGLTALMQPGMQEGYAQVLREGWQIEDKGIVQARLTVTPVYSVAGSASSSALGLNLGFFDQLKPRLQSHTAILSDAAHASSDLGAHQRTAWSHDGWKSAAEASYDVGRKIQSYASPVDAGFNRANPVFDWLEPWAGKLPAHHTQTKPFAEKVVHP